MILKGENAEFPKMTRKEKKAEKQRKKEAKRGAKLLDPEEGLMEHEMERPLTPMERPFTPTPQDGDYGRNQAGERYEPYRGYGM